MSTIMPKEIADQIGGARREMLACEIHGEYMAIALPNGHVSPCPDCFEMKLRRESGREMKSVQSQYLSLGFAEYRVLYPQRGQCVRLCVAEYTELLMRGRLYFTKNSYLQKYKI